MCACVCALPVAVPSSACALVVEPVGLLFVAYVAVSSACSILCAVGSTLLAAYLISHTHKYTHTNQNQSVLLLQIFCCCHGDVYPWQ